jgi:D-cysteine desulfhydrase family pyridoxal phosphate-dependent enzyme
MLRKIHKSGSSSFTSAERIMNKHLPRQFLAQLPTPIEHLLRLSGDVQLWIKRDDQTGRAFGGNKTRKLEFLTGDALSLDSKMLITRGAPQSNHCRQTAAVAARLGLKCVLVLSGNPVNTIEGNILLDRLYGAQLVWSYDADPDEVLASTFEAQQSRGQSPYLIPYGGSNYLGVAAYIEAMLEFLDQDLPVDRIVFASSSGGTQAGLILGAAVYGFQGKITGISVEPEGETLRRSVAALVNRAATQLGIEYTIDPDDVEAIDSYLGAGYSIMGLLEKNAIELFARQEGILLDPVYSGRAAGGMMDLIEKGVIQPGERVLYWHTGGIPAIFAYADELS